MKKLLLAILLLVLVTLSVPALRQRAGPPTATTFRWLGEKLEGPASPILNPWREVNTKSEMSRITGHLARMRNQGRPPPPDDEFQQFVIRQRVDETGTDQWGTPYVLETSSDSAFVRSGGPDRELRTEDDILVSVRYPRANRRGGPTRRR